MAEERRELGERRRRLRRVRRADAVRRGSERERRRGGARAPPEDRTADGASVDGFPSAEVVAGSAVAAVLPRAARRPSRMPTTMSKLVIVNNDSAGPWSQSTLARMSSYCSLAYIAHGIVPKTKTRRNLNPKSARGGMRHSGIWRKYRNAR